MPLGISVDARQNTAGNGDVDFLGRAEVALYRHLDHRPHRTRQIGIGLVLRQRSGRGDVGARLGQPLAVSVDGLARGLDRGVQGGARC